MKTLLIVYVVGATGLGALLGWLVVRNIHWGELASALTAANPILISAALGAILTAGYLRGLRWHLLLQNPPRTSPMRLFMIEQAGTALDTLSPLRVLDEIVQTGILMFRDRIQLGTILATLALQRAFEFATTVLLLGGGALLLTPLRPFWPWLAGATAFGCLSLVLLFSAGPALARLRILSKIQIIPQFTSAILLLRRKKRRAIAAFTLSVTQALLVGLAGWLTALATHIEINLPSMIIISLGILFFSSMVPGLPMAIGSFEFAALYLLGLWGIGREQAIAFSIVLHMVLFIPPIAFAIVFLPREGLHSIRELRHLARNTRAHISTAQQTERANATDN